MLSNKMKNRFERLAEGVLAPMNPYVSVVLGLLTFCWGLWVLNPAIQTFTRSDIYSEALSFMPEWGWGLWATACGLGILVSIFYGRTRPMACALGATVWHWFTISGFFWWGDYQNTAGLTYGFIAIYALLAYLNIRVNYVKQGLKRI